nr:hypothetical protein MtrunA17_Chr4g0055701 [Ipomoea batatas]
MTSGQSLLLSLNSLPTSAYAYRVSSTHFRSHLGIPEPLTAMPSNTNPGTFVMGSSELTIRRIFVPLASIRMANAAPRLCPVQSAGAMSSGKQVNVARRFSSHSDRVAVPLKAITTLRRPSREISSTSSQTATYPIQLDLGDTKLGTLFIQRGMQTADVAYRFLTTLYPLLPSPQRASIESSLYRHVAYVGDATSKSKLR